MLGSSGNLRPRNNTAKVTKITNAKILSMVVKNAQELVKENKSSNLVKRKTVRLDSTTGLGENATKKKPSAPSKKVKSTTFGKK